MAYGTAKLFLLIVFRHVFLHSAGEMFCGISQFIDSRNNTPAWLASRYTIVIFNARKTSDK